MMAVRRNGDERSPTRRGAGVRSLVLWCAVAAAMLTPAAVGCPRPQSGGRTVEAAGPDAAAPAGDAETMGDWQTVQRGELATVFVERRLYERSGEEHFLIRVRVENLTDRPLGVELRDYWTVVYPNQWGALAEPTRTVVDERRMPARALHGRGCTALHQALADGALAVAAARDSVEYFREFNASGRAGVDAQATERYVYVSLAGQTLLTDGERCENLTLDWGNEGSTADSDLLLQAPVAWATLPEDGVVVAPEARAPVDVPARTGLQMELPSPADPRHLTVAVETGDGDWRMTGCESTLAGACDKTLLVVLDEQERRTFSDLIAAIDGMPRCEPLAILPNCFSIKLELDDDLRNTCLPLEWFPRGVDRGPLGGSDPCLAELRLAWWIYETFDHRAREAEAGAATDGG
jgi:hypothetical protein